MNKFAMVTRCDSKAKELGEVTHPILKNYADDWGCDFVVLGDEIMDTGDYEKNHYRVLAVKDLFDKYERILIIDSDVIIMPGSPNPFDIVPETHIGTIYEDVGSRKPHRHMVIKAIQEWFGDIGWERGYINTGFFICSAHHRDIFNEINGKLWEGFGYDDALIGYNINKLNWPVHELSYKWNHTAMFSEAWNNNADRFGSYVIHYAGRAGFPDDQSGRKDKTNALVGRIELIKNDIDRITEGLMSFTEAKPLAKQGYGSTVYECKYGVQKMPIVLKVPNTKESFEREVENYKESVPYQAYCLGQGSDPQVGNFLMLEKLEPLPEKLTGELMCEVIYCTLQLLFYCYNNDITWIPRIDHIGLDKDGFVKFIDFGDDPYDCPAFFGEGEAVCMDGETDLDGNYIMRYTFPLSGFRAIMNHLIKRSGLVDTILPPVNWERSLVAAEYQKLEDVHQPVNIEGFETLLRTESEPDDPNYKKLVAPNRGCKDRADMLREHLGIGENRPWLDIGCNVGWFQFEFAREFQMTGLEKDPAKVEFARLIRGLQNWEDINFVNTKIDIEYADAMPEYDIISAFSILHLKLVADRNAEEFWILIEAICKKVKTVFFFEFPPHAWATTGCVNQDDFMSRVQDIGKFKKVEQIGITDARRPMLKCSK